MSKRYILSVTILLTSFTGLYGQVDPDHVDKDWLESSLLKWVKGDNDFADICRDNSFYNTRLSFIGGSMAKLYFYCRDEHGNRFYGDSKAKLSYKGDKISAKYYHSFDMIAYRNGTLPDDRNERLFYPVGTFKEYFDDGRLWTISKWSGGEIKSLIWYSYSYNRDTKKYANPKKGTEISFQRINDGGKSLYNADFTSRPGFKVPFSQSADVRKDYNYDTGKLRKKTFYKQEIARHGYVNEAAAIYDEEGKIDYSYVQKVDKESGRNSYQYTYTDYDSNGDYAEEGVYKSSSWDFIKNHVSSYNRTGRWKYFFPGGEQVKEEGTYKSKAKKDGLWTEYYKSGDIKYKRNYTDGEYDGPYSAYHENGTIWIKGQYENGRVLGTWNYWRDDGSLFSLRTYDRKKVIGFDGSIRLMGAWVIKNYDKSGRLTSEGFQQNGRKRGYWKYYHENGQLQDEGNYNFDKKVGTWKHYEEDGTLWTIQKWKDGKQDGEFVWYHNDGSSLSTKVTYAGGKMTGDKYRYFINGDLHKILTYNDGKLMNIKRCIDREGNNLDCGTLKDGNGTNIRYYWEDDQKVQVNRVETYVNGLRQDEGE